MLTKDTLIQLLSGLPVESVSLDNGSEFSELHTMEQELNAPVYFAEPHKPWQRGTNENTNGILRFYFPAVISATLHRMNLTLLSAKSTPAQENASAGEPTGSFSSSCVALH